MSNHYDLERTVWNFKSTKDDNLQNENIEVILNFFDKSQFEININKFYSSLYSYLNYFSNVDLDSYLQYPTEEEYKPCGEEIFESSKLN